ncbi:MAG: isoprenylcysteine carboxylmethyltransferase family protein, partial [Holosporaceae bacterium]|nr:isoprenylcysteine carboxylmethyltransferase family protein [Holosporaceae bacterium]
DGDVQISGESNDLRWFEEVSVLPPDAGVNIPRMFEKWKKRTILYDIKNREIEMLWRWIKTVILLPLNVLVIVPLLILYFSDFHWKTQNILYLIIGTFLMIVGLFLAGWTMRLFVEIGKGTAAPWDPPKKLVVAGPYCYVRNPMITSVLIMLIAESLLFCSWHIFAWFIVFFLGNTVYFPFFEEKDLEKRFGNDYLQYKCNVPRWIPRLNAWKQR